MATIRLPLTLAVAIVGAVAWWSAVLGVIGVGIALAAGVGIARRAGQPWHRIAVAALIVAAVVTTVALVASAVDPTPAAALGSVPLTPGQLSSSPAPTAVLEDETGHNAVPILIGVLAVAGWIGVQRL